MKKILISLIVGGIALITPVTLKKGA